MEQALGRTFSDLIAQHPKAAFGVLILSFVTGLFIVLQGYSVSAFGIELTAGQAAQQVAADPEPQPAQVLYSGAALQVANNATIPMQQAASAFGIVNVPVTSTAPAQASVQEPVVQASTPQSQAKKEGLRKYSTADFEQFLGLRYQDALGKAIETFGAPTKTKNNAVVYTQNGRDILTVKSNRDKRVDFIELNGAEGRDFVKSKKTGDPKFKLLGLNVSEIEAQLGKPDRVSGDRYAYQSGRIKTTFLCPKDSSFQCVGITVEWEY